MNARRVENDDNDARVPPHSLQAEQSVLGGLLLDNSGWDRLDALTGADFYRDDHKLIFDHIGRLIDQLQPADVITVQASLAAVDQADRVGGFPYLNALAQNTPSAANIRHYAQLVRTRSLLRRLISAGYEIAESGLNPEGRDVRHLVDEAEAKVLALGEDRSAARHGIVEIQPLLSDVVQRIDELYHQQDQRGITGVATGFVDLDATTSGLQPGELIVIAGRPSMGKTAFAINIGEHVAINKGLSVLVFSMEMGGSQLALRMLGSVGRLDQHRLRTGRLNDDDWPRLTNAIMKLQSARIYIDESASLDVLAIRSRTRQLMRRTGKLGLIIIDYIQLISGTARSSNENRATELGEISRSLKGLAKEMACPVVALSQLNRAVDGRTDKRPLMSDLRESGAIEQDADVILFIYRDEVYHPDSMDRGTAEIIVGKQRNGPIGNVRLTFDGRFTKFDNFSSN